MPEQGKAMEKNRFDNIHPEKDRDDRDGCVVSYRLESFINNCQI